MYKSAPEHLVYAPEHLVRSFAESLVCTPEMSGLSQVDMSRSVKLVEAWYFDTTA
jgi:hypothetical protein